MKEKFNIIKLHNILTFSENENKILENKELKEKIDILKNKNKSMTNKLINNENLYKKKLDDIKHLNEEIKNNNKDNKSLLSQLSSLGKELEK